MKILRMLLATGIPLFLWWVIFRPPINLQSTGFWGMIIVCFGISAFVNGVLDYMEDGEPCFGTIIPFVFATGTLIIALIMGAIGSNLFHAKTLQKVLDVTETKEFTETVESIDINSIPRIDASVAVNLANRKLGELEDVVSQFETDEYSTLINYKDKPYRVIPLKYASVMKYFNNKDTGIPGYILVDLITQEASYVKLDEGIKYSPSALFKNDLKKRIRAVYPSAILGEYNFEIDDEGTPYWIVPEISPKVCFGVKTVENVIVVNAITGDVEKHPISDVPEWIDRAIDTELVVEQIDNWGQYKDGWWNSKIGQKGVKLATELYNFIIQDNDVYLFTGMTSANGSDQSNIGFFLVNMRTGEAKYTSCASVNESSAKQSAQTIYQEKFYVATDPLLLNVDGKPTYCTSLKDNAGLVKVYALVCATDHTIVGYASEQEGMEKAIANYKLALEGKSFTTSDVDSSTQEEVTLQEVKFAVTALNEVIVNGTTSYCIKYKNEVYIVPITANATDFLDLKVDDVITGMATYENNYYLIDSFEAKSPEVIVVGE